MTWDDLEEDAASGSIRRGECGVLRMLHSIGEEHGPKAVESVTRTMANVRLTSPSIRSALERRLTELGDVPSVVTIQRHRNGSCSCPKEKS